MTVLGWSLGTSFVENVRFVPAGGEMSIAFLDGEKKPANRRVFVAQCHLAETAHSFLPVSASLGAPETEVFAWTEANKGELAARLHELSGCVQVSLQVTVQDHGTRQNNSWLRQRAQARAAKSAALAITQQKLVSLVEKVQSYRHNLRFTHGSCVLDLLTGRHTADALKDCLKELVLSDSFRLHDLHGCAIVGPLPAFSFASLGALK